MGIVILNTKCKRWYLNAIIYLLDSAGETVQAIENKISLLHIFGFDFLQLRHHNCLD